MGEEQCEYASQFNVHFLSDVIIFINGDTDTKFHQGIKRIFIVITEFKFVKLSRGNLFIFNNSFLKDCRFVEEKHQSIRMSKWPYLDLSKLESDNYINF